MPGRTRPLGLQRVVDIQFWKGFERSHIRASRIPIDGRFLEVASCYSSLVPSFKIRKLRLREIMDFLKVTGLGHTYSSLVANHCPGETLLQE
ncbi:Vacuolar protein sorting-associated protein 13A [Manis javanica]|nr:Vacuolar protein sorting-associated protein 13A [Manis javanica]